ncbi:flavin-containing monooxygenase [Cellulomonas alba]|uniref:NAD(P)-binding domain-containing protein n=1 Tax=Cellulomonas alba TaxID=3053467 RepID=A0ABT7SI60_9CELL|nr:NAD(P)-binding domain-containing protein [Cellulomonas alba]MDM7855883.1 NAD(P)-binding domain-containing protein [Cellulomonas alba]
MATPDAPVLVVGGGPAGLAAAAALRARGVPVAVLERAPTVGTSWRGHYERLHLHTTRRLSALPGLAIPRAYGRWVARADVVRYLETYAAHHRLDVHGGVDVVRIDPRDGGGARIAPDAPDAAAGWRLTTADGAVLTAPQVVVATGNARVPVRPAWADAFTGDLRHTADYRDATPFRGRDVLVVGVGNSGAEIALDLVEGGAARVRVAVRTPPHVLRRSTFGWAAQQTGLLVRRLPVRLVDRVATVLERAEVPDLSTHGLVRPTTGLATRAAQGSLPLLDIGFVDALRSGRVDAVPAVAAAEGGEVVLADGTRLAPDAVVLATGYRPGLASLLGHLGLLDRDGYPVPRAGRVAPGLYVTGFTTPLSGMLRELRLDAARIARAVERERRLDGHRQPPAS